MGDRSTGAASAEIIVQFVEGENPQPITVDDQGRLQAQGIDFRPFDDLLAPVGDYHVRPSFSLDPQRLLALRTRAEKQSGRNDIPWLNYFVRVSLPANTSVKKLVADLRALAIVADAGVVGRTRPAAVYAQAYFGPATDGVDADHAWSHGGDGKGLRVCVCDWAFADRHPDLPPIVDLTAPATGSTPTAPTTPQLASDLPPHADHGTAALGTLLALDDGEGTKGLCPMAEGFFASVLPASGSESTVADVTNAIDVAVEALRPGDVLLVECQVELEADALIQGEDEASKPVNHPADFHLDVRAAILTGVESGIAVVLPAGNGAGDLFGQDLASLSSSEGYAIWKPSGDNEDDCGAILVGAGEPSLSGGATMSLGAARTRRPSSNFGARVTCQGWGRGIATPGWLEDYTGDVASQYIGFSDTSGASAMVAGVVACLQSAAKHHLGAPLPVPRVRELLATTCFGSPQPEDDAAATPIGSLPDLRRLLRAARITPDLYLRDGKDDDGTEPYPRVRACASPDILVLPAPSGPSPANLAGEEDWQTALAGRGRDADIDHRVFLRIRNASHAAGGARVDFHTTPAAPYAHPSSWRRLDTVPAPGVPPRGVRVLGPIDWPASTRGGPRGLATFIRRPGETAPDLVSLSTRDYARLLGCRHDVTLRQVHELEARPGKWTAWFEFQVRGDPHRALTFDFTLASSLPDGAQIETDPAMGGPRSIGSPRRPILPDGGDHRHLELALGAGEVRTMRLRLALPRRVSVLHPTLFLDQWHEGWHLGRLTCVLRVPIQDSPS